MKNGCPRGERIQNLEGVDALRKGDEHDEKIATGVIAETTAIPEPL
jgi:hypothetical protein